MTRIATALLSLLFFVTAAAAREAAPAREGHPVLWRIAGKSSTVYLLGSVHMLSPDIRWRDARIDGAIEAADAYFFETPTDNATVMRMIAEKGSLPSGQSLRAMLPEASQKDLDEDLAMLGLPEAPLDNKRPWLAEIALSGMKMIKQGTLPTAGVDMVILARAQERGRPVRYLEPIEAQIALLASDDMTAELKAFELFLKNFRQDSTLAAQLSDAWLHGDEARLTRLMLKDLDKEPGTRKAVLDDRNAAWVEVLKGVLDHESGIFLVTVGAGHLITERGVPALLKKAGYKVERI
jgi:uncharacterized protein YbaP (TraB family)